YSLKSMWLPRLHAINAIVQNIVQYIDVNIDRVVAFLEKTEFVKELKNKVASQF
ncbi:hypothetical protein L9F63_020660, partial [Diploptera punctata]